MKSEELKLFIKELKQLPTLSPIALRIVEIAGDEGRSTNEIATLIESDQSLASKILKISNYALLRSGREASASSIKRATGILGTNMVRSIALSLIVINLFEKKTSKVFKLVGFWQHSAACAIACELLAKRFSYPHPEEAFIAGLLHDLGKLIFYQWKTDEYENIVSESNSFNIRLLEVEEKHLGAGHTQAAKLLMEYWNFPDSLVRSAWLHHQPMSEFKTDRFSQLPFIVKCANSLCHIQRFGSSGNPVSDLNREQLKKVTELSEDDMLSISYEVLNLFDEVSKNYNWEGRTPDLFLTAVANANDELVKKKLELQEVKSQLKTEQGINKVIYDLQEMLSFSMTIIDAIEKTITLLGEIIPYKRIMGFIFLQEDKAIEGCFKTNQSEKIEHVILPFEGDPSNINDQKKLREQISILEKTVKNMNDNSTVYTEIASALNSPDLKVQPMFINKRTIGMIMIEMAQSKLSRHEKSIFLRKFTLATTIAIERFIVTNKLDNEMEDRAQLARREEEVQARLYHSERLASVGRLASGAAHEINKPLSAILLKAQLLLDEASTEKEKNSLNFIIDHGKQITKTIKSLIRVTKSSAPNIEQTSLEHTIEQVLSLLENRIIISGVKINKEFEQGIPLINAEAEQIEQVFFNIIINAVQAMDDGGTLTINMAVENDRKNICVKVSDTGSGIDAEKITNIFEPFYSSQKDRGSSGLGLAICQSIIQSHKGKISVTSTPDKGSTFLIHLPIDNRQDRDYQSHVEVLHHDQNESNKLEAEKTSIIIIDDEDVLRTILSDIFTNKGFDTDNTSNWKDGLYKLNKKAFDLVIINLKLALKDGCDILQTIKKGETQSPKIIVISNTTNENDFTIAKKSGAFACLKRPFDISELLTIINKAVESIDNKQ